ncbi:GTPase HflX [Helcococcus kunzii]|uniref:GTPase HflX n=1 Tax=Helcococcus kunzii ATCC 51366 TaxID=883114 RepID=H3NNL8_9FIRM|nr:GTPase HflX [Helcococcus kunzii]EHR33993.1 GTP-binding protein HflX [Helcococcus kunzii ATCC 51366]MCT1795601.1 GTPase HflX [Helcococcus kunzii]MCT1988833.1 GTPase HflX [Helcococcus kunzii]QUY64844.1 GTPase HflX [Helcococcus kunzii]
MDKEKIITVHLNNKGKYTENQINAKIEEMKELVRSSDSEFVASVVQNVKEINSKYYIGSGKAEEIKEMAENLEVDTIIFDNELTGSQIKNLEDIIGKKILDRTGLILDIFATRAKTKEAKLQVKLAQLEYMLPRLVGYRNYLSREGAGVGTRGPGEQKLETDRRAIQREISSIKSKLTDIERIRNVERSKRINSEIPIVSLIGYSNVGKSTILNSIGDMSSNNTKNVFADNMLFATLDTSARKVKLPNDRDIIITDTVGFVTDLPTKLVESFKSTLEEINYSDLLLIVVDASNEDYEMQIDATKSVLKDMGIIGKDILYVFNKMDLNPDFVYYGGIDKEIYISARKEEDLDKLLNKIQEILFKDFKIYRSFVPYTDLDIIRDKVYIQYKDREKFTETGVETYLYLNNSELEKYRKYIIDGE